MRSYPTLYRGVEYRSRLEARWAAFFTEIGWRTTRIHCQANSDPSSAADSQFHPPAGVLGEFWHDSGTGWNDGEKFGANSRWSWDTGL